jgi:hypothetical protein
MTGNSALAPDELGPTVCVGEILVEIMSTTVGEGFWKPRIWSGHSPVVRRQFLSTNAPGSAVRRRW